MTTSRTPSDPRHVLAHVMTRIYDERLTTPSGGNLSVLDDDGGLWVTPRSVDKGRLSPDSMVRIAQDGTWSGDFQPTSEWPFHRAILRARPDCRAVAHAHPTSLVAFSLVGRSLAPGHFPDLQRWVGRMDFTPFAIPGTEQLGTHLQTAFAAGCDAALMENHGAVTCGRDLWEAFHRFDSFERMAGMLIGAERLGGLRPLDTDDQRRAQTIGQAVWRNLRVDSNDHAAARDSLAEYIRRAHGRGLLSGLVGAMSVRCGQGALVVPDGADRASVRGADLLYVEGDGSEGGRSPDAMTSMHLAIYAAHGHVNAVATALPVGVMAFAASGVPYDARTIPEAYMFLKTVPTLPFAARVDAARLAEALSKATPVAIIENACVVVTGASPFAVFDRLEVAEFTARAALDARAIGRVNPMADGVLAEICRAYGC